MIKLTDVTKTYIAKSKSKVRALKGVSFELGANGMTFILGKSGSGKSTLLNLLGGLDKPTSGTMLVDGIDMQAFTQSDYESYRNAYVGFVFQEYNLLDDFNVKDNVALALQLSKGVNIDEKVKEALRQVELGEEYLKRRVGELSGGEKQRVAIARAIVKDSKMILADEPTGNLDSATGESVWNILKNLSVTRPVIIVSHDRESAEKYADRIIEISNGKIVADNGAEQTVQPAEQKKFAAAKQRLSFAMLLKMGFNSLFKRAVKTICIILVSAFTVCALLASQLVLTFLPERGIAKHIRLHQPTAFAVAQGHNEEYGLGISILSSYTRSDLMRPATKRYIKQNAQTMDWGYAESKQQMLDFGFEFIGDALELDERSYYLSEAVLERLFAKYYSLDYSETVIINGKEVFLNLSGLSAEELVGKQVRFTVNGIDNDHFYTLAGVYKHNDISAPEYIALEKFEGRQNSNVRVNRTPNEASLEIGDKQWTDEYNISTERFFSTVLTQEGVISASGFTNGHLERTFNLKDNEVVLTFKALTDMFGGNAESAYIKRVDNEYTVLQMPEILGKTVSVKLRDPETGAVLVDYGECTIKGIVVGSGKDNFPTVYVNNSNVNVAQRQFNSDSIILKTDTVKDAHTFLVTLRTKYAGYVSDLGKMSSEGEERVVRISDKMYDMESVKGYGVIMISICVVLAIVMILLVINLISFSINNRKKEIGILSALGASAWDITKIFVLETLTLSLVIFALSIAGLFSMVDIFNTTMSDNYALEYTLTFFVTDIYSILTLFGVCFVALPLFALLPAISIAKLKPIDAIRAL